MAPPYVTGMLRGYMSLLNITPLAEDFEEEVLVWTGMVPIQTLIKERSTPTAEALLILAVAGFGHVIEVDGQISLEPLLRLFEERHQPLQKWSGFVSLKQMMDEEEVFSRKTYLCFSNPDDAVLVRLMVN